MATSSAAGCSARIVVVCSPDPGCPRLLPHTRRSSVLSTSTCSNIARCTTPRPGQNLALCGRGRLMAPSKLRFTVSQVSGEVRASPLPPGPAYVLAAPGDDVQPGQAQGGAITRCLVWGIDPHTGARLTRRRTPTTLHASCRWHPALKRVAGSALGTNHPRPWGLRVSAHLNARVPPCVALGGSGAKESWSGSDQRLRPWLQQTRRGRPLADRNLSRREAESRHLVSPNHAVNRDGVDTRD